MTEIKESEFIRAATEGPVRLHQGQWTVTLCDSGRMPNIVEDGEEGGGLRARPWQHGVQDKVIHRKEWKWKRRELR